jgi:hypothetical protein
MPRRNKIIRGRGMSLPTPVHQDFYGTLSLGTSLGTEFAKGLVLFTTSFDSPTDGDSKNPHHAPRSMLVGDCILQTVIDAAASFIADIRNIELTLMKVPQDYFSNVAYGNEIDLPTEFPENHPEWVVCTRFVGKPSDSGAGQEYQPLTIRSRKRVRLFRGDVLALVVRGRLNGVAGGLLVSGVLQCRTRLD